jgi:hypothetical protein
MQFLDLSSNKDFKNNAKQNLEFLLYGHTKRFIQGHAPTSFKNGHPKCFMQIIYILEALIFTRNLSMKPSHLYQNYIFTLLI